MSLLLASICISIACLATASDLVLPLNLTRQELKKLTKIRVVGSCNARVRYVKIPRGETPRLTVKRRSLDDPSPMPPVVSFGASELRVKPHICEDESLLTSQTTSQIPGGLRTAEKPQDMMSNSWRAAGWLGYALGSLAGYQKQLLALAALSLPLGAQASPQTCNDEVDIEIALPDDSPDLSTPEARVKLVEELQKASVPPLPTDNPQTGGADGFMVDKSNFRFYVNGQHRRPTDPASNEEILAAQTLLFGTQGSVRTLSDANALNAQVKGWGAVSKALRGIGGIDMATCADVKDIPPASGDPSAKEAYSQFLEWAASEGFPAAHAKLQQTQHAAVRRAISLWKVNRIASAAPDREHVMATETAIEAGRKDYAMRRLVFVRMDGGATAITENGNKIWGSEIHIAVDVSRPESPFVEPSRTEVYSKIVRDKTIPQKTPLSQLDAQYLVAAVMALYGPSHTGVPRRLFPMYMGNPQNQEGSWDGKSSKAWSTPFAWLDAKAATYGKKPSEHLFYASMMEYSASATPMDGHNSMTGVYMFPVPLTMVYAVNSSGVTTGVDKHNTLIGSKVSALCFYGRGLTFTPEAARELRRAMAANVSESDFVTISHIVAQAIKHAWGDDEASPGSNFHPGRLQRRSRDGVEVPAIVLKHSYDVPTYVNHATSAAVTGHLLDGLDHRDTRDNLDNMAPPEKPDGTPMFTANGKPRRVVEPLGRNFEVDGYAVTYKVGITWKFMLGFDPDAGLVMYNLRIVLPPSRAHPKGREVPYLYRAFIPNFGTDYSASNLGDPAAYLFKENHYTATMGIPDGSICQGVTLPIFRSLRNAYLGELYNKTISRTTYGLGIPDPFSARIGHKAEIQEIPLMSKLHASGWIPQCICLQELNLGRDMWHDYTAQHLHALQVMISTKSDAYNVVMNFKLRSDGKFSVGETLHGKPALGTHGIPSVGGQYTSGGRGGFAPNHMHWHIIALEPHLKMDEKGIVNKIQVSDQVAPQNEPQDWFGRAFHRRTRLIENTTQSELLTFDYKTQRYWRIAAINKSSGDDLGGLKISSNLFGPPIQLGNHDNGISANETYAGNHWWLRQDIHILNSTGRRDSTVLASALSQHPGYDPDLALGHPLGGESRYDRPIVFCSIKLVHEVVEEEMPAQSGFANIDVNLSPHNLFGFNPNILVRQEPDYIEWNENQYMQSYSSPYRSEYEAAREPEPGI